VIFRTRSSSETILFLIYAYRGEGDSAVWFKGRYYPDFDIGFTKRSDGAWCHGEHCPATYVDMGKTVWWAEVRLKSGVIVWVDMDGAGFEGVCLLARSADSSRKAPIAAPSSLHHSQLADIAQPA
jgi:hypothetical protein